MVINLDRSNIEKIAQNPEDKVLLAKIWDKINAGLRKNILASTCFLSPRELEMARYLFGDLEGLHAFGGYADAERKMLIFLPEYLDESALCDEDRPGGLPQPPGFSGRSHGCRYRTGNGGRHLRGQGKL